jgi:hypothetical protein
MSEVTNLNDAAAEEWWQALSRLVGAMEANCADTPPPVEGLNAALRELRQHGRRTALSDPRAQLVARLIRVLA